MIGEEELEKLKSRLKEEFSGYTELAGGKNYRYHHLLTTRKICLRLMEEVDEEVDEEVVEVAALFHDIGRAEDIEDGEMDPFEGHEGHAVRGAEKVEEFVSEFLDKKQLERVERIILNHHSEAETVDRKVVQDADRISNFGVSNLWRQIHYACQHELEFGESVEYFWNTAVEDYEEKIEELYFEHSKEVAEQRLEKHKKAIRRMEEEKEAEDI